MIFQRYFIRKSFTRYDISRLDLIATTAIFLAGKIEEDPRRLRDVISTMHKVILASDRTRIEEIYK